MRSSEPGCPDDSTLLDPSAKGREQHVRSCDACRRRVRVLQMGLSLLTALERRPEPPAPPGAGPLELARRGEEIGRRLLREAQDGDVMIASFDYDEDPAFGHGIVYACQKAAALAMKSPADARELAVVCRAAAASIPRRHRMRALAVGECLLLESQALRTMGDVRRAAIFARRGLRVMERSDAPLLSRGRALYFLASALAPAGEVPQALDLLRQALVIFIEAGQDHWVGRAHAMIATAMFHRANDPEALLHFDKAIELLDHEADAHSAASTLQNKAGLLLNLGRRDEARQAFQKALAIAMRAGATAPMVMIRVNLLSLALDEGRFQDVVTKGEKLLRVAENALLDQDAFYCRLFLAEANAALGRYGTVRELAKHLASYRPESLSGVTELNDLLRQLDGSDAEALDRLRRFRLFLETRSEAALLEANRA